MASQLENYKSYSKLSQIYNAFRERGLKRRFIKSVLRKIGDINYKIPPNSCINAIEPNLVGGTALHMAALKNDAEIFEILLKHDADFTIQNQQGRTALHCAIYHQNLNRELISYMLSLHLSFADPSNPCDDNGLSHFHIACLYNRLDIVNLFLNAGIPVDLTVDNDSPRFAGYTPLHFAALAITIPMICVLLKFNANPRAKDARGLTPFHILLEKKINLLNYYGSSFVDAPSDTISLIDTAMSLLIDNNPIDDIGLTHFHIACTQYNTSTVEYFLKQDIVDVNQPIKRDSPIFPGYTPLHIAANCNLSIVRMLIEKGANFEAEDANGVKPMEIFWNNSKPGNIDLLFEGSWKDVMFADGQTRLVDFYKATLAPELLSQFLLNVVDIMTTIDQVPESWAGRTFLHFAVMFYSSNDIIRQCIQEGLHIQIGIQDSHGSTPIHLAFRMKKFDIVQILMEHSQENFVDDEGLSYVHIAVDLGRFDFVQRLVRYPTDNQIVYRGVKTCGRYVTPGSTALHVAVANANSIVINHIIGYQLDYQVEDANGHTPLHRLLQLSDKNDDVFETILSLSSLTDEIFERIGLTRLHIAICCNILDIDRFITPNTINAVIKCNDKSSFWYKYDGYSPLLLALKKRLNVDNIQMLLDNGADLLTKCPRGNTPLCSALNINMDSSAKNIIIQQVLTNETLRKRLEEQSGITTLHFACHTVNHVAITWLLTSQHNVNATVKSDCILWSGCTALHVLLKTVKTCQEVTVEFLDILKSLLAAGADVTIADNNGDTPIHVALQSIPIDSLDSVLPKLVAQLKVFDVNPINKCSMSHFHAACFVNNAEMVKSFLESGVADVNQPIDFFSSAFAGSTPLHLAVDHRSTKFRNRKLEIVRLLLTFGADVTVEDNHGQTALHKAVKLQGQVDILEYLVASGARIDSENIFEQQPLEILLRSRNLTVDALKFFESHGCRLNISNALTQQGYISMLISSHYHPNQNSTQPPPPPPPPVPPARPSLSLARQFFDIPGYGGLEPPPPPNFAYGALEPPPPPYRAYGALMPPPLPYHFINYNVPGPSRPETPLLQPPNDIIQCFEIMVDAFDSSLPDNMGRNLIHNIVTTNTPYERLCNLDELIQRFQGAGVDIDLQDKRGKTALHLAAQFGNLPAVRDLLNNGADINILDKESKTPVNYAVEFHNNQKYCPERECHKKVIAHLRSHIRNLVSFDLEVGPNSVHETNASYIDAYERRERFHRILYRRHYDDDYGSDIVRLRSRMRIKVVIEQPRLTLKDFLSETGKGLTCYPFISNARREKIDTFFREYKGELKDLCMLQHQKAIKRVELVKVAIDSVWAIAGSVVPVDLIENIFQDLSNSDLRNYIEAASVIDRNVIIIE